MNSAQFVDNKYKKWYLNIISNANNRNYDSSLHEKHHIIPLSLGGTNDSTNLACLTFREHFICHWLLTKFTTSTAKGKMCGALRMMMNKSSLNDRVLTNKQYEIARMALSRTKRKMSDEFRKKQSENKTGEKNPMFGRKQTEETKRKIANKISGYRKTQKRIQCPHCKKVGGIVNMKRYHFNNCKIIGINLGK